MTIVRLFDNFRFCFQIPRSSIFLWQHMGGYHAGLLGQAHREYGGLPANMVGQIGIRGGGMWLLICDYPCTSRQVHLNINTSF